MTFEWRCPFCERGAIVTDDNFFLMRDWFSIRNSHGPRVVEVRFIVCPNPKCRQFTLDASIFEAIYRNGSHAKGNFIQNWQLIPPSSARTFPDYIPKPILDDYKEACLVRDLSPKASATLSRRCLQGMIRDFWGIKGDRLIDEINALKEKVDPVTWDAIDATRKIGNIGAHMEKDISTIVEVDPDEAKQLIGLIESLISDWYVLRFERQSRLAGIVETAKAKQAAKEGKTVAPEKSSESQG
jgi:hypothetical protein